ncbi:restriction endonuclease subunit S [Vibrio vulnificus]|uniref:restriction endonuclease subunit S n=1 Tax=Vibrio TaxID=662 RepID=UPI0010296787|nr:MULTISPECIES: restriction endonuclease subunit S [Vibrio]RZP75572.1 restriction endonuclease subunit S [Vibrio vulnificus]HDY7904961.1 restriction endonuclease subunit S [Vibrio vulnificus]HDY7927744.1 restriction endonuclease subunit S [Vibrio vulnificus]
MVPNGWKLTSLGEVCSGSLQTGPFGSQLHAHEYTHEGVPVLMPKDLINYRANNESAAKIPEHRADDLKKHTLQSGDLLFSRRGDVARFALIESDYPRSLCGTGCLKATPNKAHSPLFLSYFLQKNAVKKWLEQNAVGQTMPNMNTAILAELPLMVASSREEEDKIAKILSTWDKAITTTEKLIESSKQQKKSLMQQLLTGKKRLVNPETGKAFEGEWKFSQFNELYKVANNKATQVKSGEYLESGRTPIVDQGKSIVGGYTNNEITYKDLPVIVFGDHTRIVKWVDFEFAQGADGTQVLKSHKSLDEKFAYYVLLNTDIPNLGYSRHMRELKERDFKYPISKVEQQKIASVLTAADKEIKVLEAKLAHFKQEKKALMQQLLTGKRRVMVAETEAA